ncbi:DUF2213 domain-containing protein [Proteus mirabilis]|uniref:DUF2213 domain-containing protein n=1 Tax=Proteus mirabilis TaxID=584 RepID=UPI0019811DE6|nr:DUF2213 domain-containing protein [Proteus mirabilis]MBN4111768.1 DUF2213 domain-containing protein [Proteus mirabilis]
MKMTDSLAFDSGTSMRSKDANGHLTVERTVISKAAVNPYYGREIPDSERLGLEPERIYYMLRDPVELERAANTFSKKQLLIKHIPVDSDEPQKQSTIGTIGSNITFEDGRLFADLCVWDGYAIGLIEAEKMKELSAGYGYTADMTSGEFEGQYYDGVMRNIIGNHVALVERGRIGRDAIISDHQTVYLEKLMKLKKGALPVVAAQIKQALGMDSDIPETQLHAILTAVKLGMDVSPEKLDGAEDEEEKAAEAAKKAQDEEEAKKKANDEEEAEKKAKDEEEAKKQAADNEEQGKKAMDSAIKLAEDQAVARVTKLFEAREEVKSLVGQVAMDSADDVYAYALKQCGVDISGVHPSAFKTMIGMVKQNRAQHQKASLGMDSAAFAEDPLTARFKQA